ncbi:MAG: thioesterase family protein [Bacillota bacterium]|nr:thioesterase family protein [Bacillota bacterium]
MNPFTTEIRVQYYDTDKMKVVHHANYIRYFETARTEYLRNEGFAYSEMEKGDFQIPILSVQAKYQTPAVYDELISVSCRLVKLGPASMEIEYEIRNAETGELHVTGRTRHGFTSHDLKPVPLKKHDPDLYAFFVKLYERDQAAEK